MVRRTLASMSSWSWINNSSLKEEQPGLEVSEEEKERVVGDELDLLGHLIIIADDGGGCRCFCSLLVNLDHGFLYHLQAPGYFFTLFVFTCTGLYKKHDAVKRHLVQKLRIIFTQIKPGHLVYKFQRRKMT